MNKKNSRYTLLQLNAKKIFESRKQKSVKSNIKNEAMSKLGIKFDR